MRRIALLLLVAGCPGESGPMAGSPSGASTGAATSTGAVATEVPTTGGTDAPPGCPDGQVDEGEACDDGNAIDGDGCNSDCTPSATLLWEWRSGTRGDDVVRAVAVEADAGVVAVGASGVLTRWAGRFAADGAPVWSRTYGAGGVVLAVAAEAGLVAGSVQSDADGHDVWYARVDADGAVAWERTFASDLGDDWATQVVAVDGGGVVAGLAAGAGGAELWARRVTLAGDEVWTTRVPLLDDFDLYPLGPGLAATADAAVLGWTHPPGFTESLVGLSLAAGSPTSSAELAGTYGLLFALAVDVGGDLQVVGTDQFTTMITRRTAGGLVLWSSPACTGENGRDVAIDGQGDVVVIGDGEAPGGSNIRLCKFSAEGALRWGKDIDGGFGGDLGYAVAIDPAGRVIAGGQMLVDGDDRDAWIAVFSP